MSTHTQPDTTAGDTLPVDRPESTADRSTQRPSLLVRAGAVCLGVAPVMFAVGIAVAPTQAEMTRESYIQSLIDEPTKMALSADLLHYSWIFWALGLIAVLAYVPFGRGRTFTVVSAVAGLVGAIQISGLLTIDFFVAEIAQRHSVADAAATLENLGTSMTIWLISAQVLAMLPIGLVAIGLARARVISWKWLLLMLAAPASVVIASSSPLVGALLILLAWSPAIAAAHHMVTDRGDD